MDERLHRLYGTSEAPAPHRLLAAGPLTAWLENGNLRYITFDGHEVLRAISYVVRDGDWGTYRPLLTDMQVEEQDDFFRVTYRGACSRNGAALSFEATVTGEASGKLSFTVATVTNAPFETNRCGFTVLHPASFAGDGVVVEHVDGSVTQTAFPSLIEPWQPFMEIRALTHSTPALRAECRLQGDTFEMEDQRNWSDASFKTYVRPLALPWPYRIEADTPNRQSVTLSVERLGASLATDETTRGGTCLRIGAATSHSMPAIGLVIAPEDIEAAIAQADRFAEIAPQAVLCHYDPTAGHGPDVLHAFACLQRICPAEYNLEYVVTGEDLLGEFADLDRAVKDAGLSLSSLGVCPAVDRLSTPPGSAWPGCPPLENIYQAARAAFPGLVVGGGMFSYFTELNRKRPPVDRLDFVTHATNPIVHAADDRSVMETLQTLPAITRSVRAFIGEHMRYRIGPSTIGMRQNPYGSRTLENQRRERICMSAEDPRQDGLFAAAWMIGYAAAIAPATVELLVPAAFTGPRGLLDAAVRPRPVFETTKWLAELAGQKALAVETGTPSLVALSASDGQRAILLAANISDLACEVDLSRLSLGETGPAVALTVIDASTFPTGAPRELPPASGALSLDALAIMRLEWKAA